MNRASKFTVAAMQIITALLLVNVVAACATAEVMPEPGRVNVSGGVIVRDGKIWIPKGFTFIAYVAPDTALKVEDREEGRISQKLLEVVKAKKEFSENSLDAAKKLNADVVRFQISQAGLDPESVIYDPQYPSQIKAAVAKTRKHGFSVILSMQHSERAGLEHVSGLPNEATLRAWKNILSYLPKDEGLIFELFNEPNGEASSNNWNKWRRGHQVIINYIRDVLGLSNVIIVDGMKAARDFRGMPTLEDRLNKIVLGVHPYIGKEWLRREEHWEEKFGFMSSAYPLLATEWNDLGIWGGCDEDTPRQSRKLLEYLKNKGVGLIGWAFDVPGSIFTAGGRKLTSQKNMTCGLDSTSGAGELIVKYFEEK